MTKTALCDDLIEGVEAIASFLYGTPTPKKIRRTRHLIDKGLIRSFKLGGLHAARKSALLADIEALEAAPAARDVERGRS